MKKRNKADAFVVTSEDGSYDIVNADILERYSIKAEVDEEGSKQLKTDGWEYDDTLLEPLYDPQQLCELLEINTYHENCVDVVARDSAGVSYDIVPVTGENEKQINKTQIADFLDNIEPSINELLYRMNYDRRATGYGALEIIREGKSKSRPVNLSHISSYTLRRTSDGKRVKQRVGTKTVWFVIYGKNYDDEGNLCDVHADTGEFYPYNSLSRENRANELLWTMEYTTKSKYYGLPKIVGAIPAISNDISRAKYNTSFFKNYGMPSFAVLVSGDFVDYEESEFLEDGTRNPNYDVTKTLKWKISKQLKQAIKNPHSAVTILVPSEGEEGNVEIELKPLSVETKEASFRLFRQDNRDEVIHAHRVPPYKVGINETGSLGGTNIQEATTNYKNDVVLPIRFNNEYLINKLVKNEFNINNWKFKIIEHDSRDYSKDIAIIKELFLMAAITPRQIIENIGDRFGLTASDNPFLDEYYLNNVPLDSIWNGGNIPLEAETVLDSLEKDLMNDAEVLDEQIRTEKSDNSNGIESASIKEADTEYKDRIQKAFDSRKTMQR